MNKDTKDWSTEWQSIASYVPPVFLQTKVGRPSETSNICCYIIP